MYPWRGMVTIRYAPLLGQPKKSPKIPFWSEIKLNVSGYVSFPFLWQIAEMISLQEEQLFWLMALEVLVHGWLVLLAGAWTLSLKASTTCQ